ncbi:MAG TPA: FAD-binding oxidoreductase [Candidatus Limnocylindrales bacterium]|nr:FAD-binding oxidoreductase [Candidatus Limnocylindrales bacterium]
MAVVPQPDPAVRPLDLEAFAATLSGELLRPGSPGYDIAREANNALYDRRPIAIVRAADAADVARTVTLAAESGVELAIKSGGHSVAGHSVTDGLLLDLGAMRGLHIDPERRLAWAQPGITAGEYTDAAGAHGLATPFGDTGSVGIAGLTLGGGIGFLVRKYGLAIDHLVAVELVTADGRILTVSEDRHPDLFWAVRGGGGNFGVVTRFQYRLVPVGQTFSGALFLPLTRDVLRGLVPVAAAAPEELSTISFIMPVPPLPFVPEEHHFKPAVVVMFVHASDDIAAGQAALAPFRALATPLAEAAYPMPYPGIYEFTAEGGKRGNGVVRSVFLETLDDAAVDTILARVTAPSSPTSMTEIRVLGGAMARVPAEATAFAHRDANVLVAMITTFEDAAELPVHEAWTQAYLEELRPKATGVYSNFVANEGEGRIRDAYPEATYARLADVKRRYDPTNLFRRNQNIRPAGSPRSAAPV